MRDSNITAQKNKWWVRYNSHSGKVLAISNKQLEANNTSSIIESSNPLCIEARTKSFRNFVVRFNPLTEQWDITNKTSKLNLSKIQSAGIGAITSKNSITSDVSLRYYIDTEELSISINPSNIQKYFNVNSIYDIIVSDMQLNFFITEKNNPDVLLKISSINPIELFKNYEVVIDVSEYAIDWSLLDIHTPRIFSNYSYQIFENRVATLLNNRVVQTATSAPGLISITPNKNGISITSKISPDYQSSILPISFLKFLVSDSIIDNIIGSFKVSTSELLTSKQIDLPLEFEWPADPVIVHRHSHITVQYSGETNG